MYFLTEEEWYRFVGKIWLQGRQEPVAEELRGWNWRQAPLKPNFEKALALEDIARKNCPSGRDLYLQEVVGIEAASPLETRWQELHHQTLVNFINRAKTLLMDYGVTGYGEALRKLQRPVLPDPGAIDLPPEEKRGILRRLVGQWQYQYQQLLLRMKKCLSWYPYLAPDSLIAVALPFNLEEELDGLPLGVSPSPRTDTFLFSEPMILDLSFQSRRHFHRLQTTGRALLWEALKGEPVNLGCIVYVHFAGKKISIKRDFHLINDRLRQWFLMERDFKMEIVAEGRDPGRLGECSGGCVFAGWCSS